ncbi:MAG: DnaA/Hda family protein [Phycisphaerae bacterium]
MKDTKIKMEAEKQLAQERRQNRCQKKLQWEHQLSQILPPLFIKAHLRDLQQPLCERILTLRPEQGLFLWGDVGTGKSHAMAAIARYYITKNKSVRRIRYDSLLLKIRDTYKNKSESELTVVTPLVDADILILEDIGTTVGSGTQESDFSIRTFLLLLDARLEDCKPTFLTSNKPQAVIERSFDARVASRLAATLGVMKLSGIDRRRQTRQ